MKISKKISFFEILINIGFVIGLFYVIPYQSNTYANFGIAVTVALSIIEIIRHRYFKKSTYIFFAFRIILLLYFWCQISFSSVTSILASTVRLKEMALNLIWGYFIYRFFRFRKDKDILVLLILSTIILSIFQISLVGFDLRNDTTSFNINTLGLLCGYSAAFSLYIYFNERKVIYILVLIFCSTVVLLTGSRQALISLLIPVATILINKNRNKKLTRFIIVVVLLIVVFELLMNVPALYEIVGYRIENLFNSLESGTSSETSMANRMMHYVKAKQLIVDKPWFGYGLDSYRFLAHSTVYSHSNFMELLVSGGIIAFALYYMPLIIMLINLVKIKKKQLRVYMLISMLITQILMEYFLVAYYRHFVMLLYVIFLIFYERELSEKMCFIES